MLVGCNRYRLLVHLPLAQSYVAEELAQLLCVLQRARHRSSTDHVEVQEAQAVDEGEVLLALRLLHRFVELLIRALLAWIRRCLHLEQG